MMDREDVLACIADEIACLEAAVFNYVNFSINDDMFAQELLPLCKLLNRLFFDYGPPCTEDLETVD